MQAVRAVILFVLIPALLPGASVAQQPADAQARVDAIFQRWNNDTSPGCAVAVNKDGRTVLSRAYGMAELEHGIANTHATIFEAGSVSKQFTAAAIILLAMEDKLSLDDDVRRYVPELPDYGTPITIRHMMNHISGLRDWGSVAGISGWGRSNRTHNHAHVVEILSRQSALNFPAGDQYSYSNSGYNLMAVIVDRVSGMSFAEFSRQRIFEPLGMNSTQWRDDYRRIVPGRSAAYNTRGSGFAINRPIEDVHGNGGLLTTVGDLLIWNESLETASLAGPEFVRLMHEQGRLNDGRQISYAGGLQIGSRAGVRSITHTGSTSGYRAYLGRFPEQRLSVALLCNVSNASPGSLGGDVADIFLTPVARPQAERPQQPAAQPQPAAQQQRAEPQPWRPTPAALRQFAGEWYSADAETLVVIYLEGDRLMMLRRPASRSAMTPGNEPDRFQSPLGPIRFIRDAAGQTNEFSLSIGRVFDMRFHRLVR